MSRDDGLRSLRCCKRRSVMSNLRGFGNKWSTSRQRIAVIHPSPLNSDNCSGFNYQVSSSDMALAAAAGLAMQGHSVSLYTSGYRQKDIPLFFWETPADLKSCLPRIMQISLFPSQFSASIGSSSVFASWMYSKRGKEYTTMAVSIMICFRVLLSCLVVYITDMLWGMLPRVIRSSRASKQFSSKGSLSLLDTIITFDSIVPHFLLASFAGQIIHFPMNTEPEQFGQFNHFLVSDHRLKRFVPHVDLFVTTSDWQGLKWSSSDRVVTTIHSPVVAVDSSSRRFQNSMRGNYYRRLGDDDIFNSRQYFVSLAWYSSFSDVLLAVESYCVFLQSKKSNSGNLDEGEENQGSTGSSTKHQTVGGMVDYYSKQILPRLVLVDVPQEDYLLVSRELHRLKLTEGDDVIVLLRGIGTAAVAEIVEHSIGLIHTPSDINEVRIPCAAMLAGVPVVATMSFCLAEPVRHESTGILVKTGSAHLLAQALEQVWLLHENRFTEWQRMGQRGKQRVLTEYSVEMFGSRLDDVLESLVSPSCPPPKQGKLQGRSRTGSSSVSSSIAHALNELVAGGSNSPVTDRL